MVRTKIPNKPLLRYPGGKFRAAKNIIPYLPDHRLFVETHCGGGSVTLQKQPSYSEILNDIDGEVVNLFRVLQNFSQARRLRYKLKYTPCSDQEFELAYEPTKDPVERARRLLVRSWMSSHPVGVTRHTGFRANGKYLKDKNIALTWRRLVDELEVIINRLQSVVITSGPANTIMDRYDTSETLFYVDPPYPFSPRRDRLYKHEMNNTDHVELAKKLHELEGMAVVSGYHCELYDELFSDWHVVEFAAHAHLMAERTEVLWISPNAWSKLPDPQKAQQMRLI